MLDPWVEKWLQDPDGGGRFSFQRDRFLAHDQTCPSLNQIWMPRKGGLSCLSDWMDCEICEITFSWEGVVAFFDDCPDSDHFFCRCCAEKTMVCPCGADCAKVPEDHLSTKPGGGR